MWSSPLYDQDSVHELDFSPVAPSTITTINATSSPPAGLYIYQPYVEKCLDHQDMLFNLPLFDAPFQLLLQQQQPFGSPAPLCLPIMDDDLYYYEHINSRNEDQQPCAVSRPVVYEDPGMMPSPTSASTTSGVAEAAADAIGEEPDYHYHRHSIDHYDQGLEVLDDVVVHAPSPHEWMAGPFHPFETGSCKSSTSAEIQFYVCTKGCGKVFRRRADMIRHTKTTKAHSSLRLFECGLCGNKFTRKCDRSRHLKKTCAHRR